MEHIRLTAISLSLLLCTVSAFAQRHYENIPALELNYGTNLFGYLGSQFLFFQLRLKYHADDRTGSLLPFLAHRLPYRLLFLLSGRKCFLLFPKVKVKRDTGEYGNQYQIHYVHKSCQIMSQVTNAVI